MTKQSSRIPFVVVIFAHVFLGVPCIASAYNYYTFLNCLNTPSPGCFWDDARWYSNPYFEVHSNVFGSGTSCFGDSSLQEDFVCAAGAYNNVTPMGLQLGWVLDQTFGYVSVNNGHSEVAIADAEILQGAPTAVAFLSYSVSYQEGLYRLAIDEADIILDEDVNWAATTGTIEGRTWVDPSARHVLMHELGHGLGMDHQDGFLCTMNSGYPNGGWYGALAPGRYSTHVPQAHDRASLEYLYDNGQHETDLALLGFRWSADLAGGIAEYHYPVNYPNHATSATREVCKGDSFPLELTIHNMGDTTQTAKVGFYLSTNSWISTQDVRTAHFSWTLGGYGRVERSFALENEVSVPLWSGVPTGTYYVGAIIDYENLVAEKDETGNNTITYNGYVEVKDCP